MAKKKAKKKIAKEPTVERITVTDVSEPTNAELSGRIDALETRIDNLVNAISKAKKVKGL